MIGDRLKSLRKQANLTQQELADKLQITRSALSLYETKKREPDNATIETFADFFNVTTDYLFGRVDKPNQTRELPQTVAPYLPEGFDELSPEAKKEVLDFIDYVMVKYGKKEDNKK